MTDDRKNCDETTEALAGDDDVIAEVQDAVMMGLMVCAGRDDSTRR